MNKFILLVNSEGIPKEYKSLKEIAKDIKIEYFRVREIYHYGKAPKKFLHPITKHLVDTYSIYDNPNLYN